MVLSHLKTSERLDTAVSLFYFHNINFIGNNYLCFGFFSPPAPNFFFVKLMQALMKNMTDAMRESRVFEILSLVRHLTLFSMLYLLNITFLTWSFLDLPSFLFIYLDFCTTKLKS